MFIWEQWFRNKSKVFTYITANIDIASKMLKSLIKAQVFSYKDFFL